MKTQMKKMTGMMTMTITITTVGPKREQQLWMTAFALQVSNGNQKAFKNLLEILDEEMLATQSVSFSYRCASTNLCASQAATQTCLRIRCSCASADSTWRNSWQRKRRAPKL